MKRGEVRWYKFKHSVKKRPVVILTRNSILEYLGEVTIAPVTSTMRDIPSEVLLSRLDGMHNDCAINCDHIQTVSKSNIGSMITSSLRGDPKRRIPLFGPLQCLIDRLQRELQLFAFGIIGPNAFEKVLIDPSLLLQREALRIRDVLLDEPVHLAMLSVRISVHFIPP